MSDFRLLRGVSPRTLLSLLPAFALLLAAGCSPSVQDQVVATVGQEKITLGDYEKFFTKSNGTREAGAAASQEEREKFLSLVVKYKLKLADAYRRGVQNSPEVKSELAQYRGSLASSYLTEREITAPGVRRLYDRRKEEIRASHILIELAQNASSADSLAAYTRAREIIQEAKAGKDFGTLAVSFSKDPSAQENKGDLYYFTGGQMVGPFEDAAYSMKPGEISSVPVRTQFGLHVIKVVDRRPSRGEIRASHLMIRFPNAQPTPEDTAATYKRIKAFQDSLASGKLFDSLARKYSEDPGSAEKGGDLGFFPRRRWPRPFDDSAFVLKVGQVSQIVRTAWGYHLIHCTDERPMKSFDELKPEIQQTYQQSRFNDDYAAFVARMKREVGYHRNDSLLVAFLAACDSTKTVRDSAGTAGVPPGILAGALMTFTGGSVSVDSVLSSMKARPDLNSTALLLRPFSESVEKVAEAFAYSAKAELLNRSNPEFATILKDYNDGILLYEVEQDRVWKRIVTSDSLLRIHHSATREKYTFPERLNLLVVTCPAEADAQWVYGQMKAGTPAMSVYRADSAQAARPIRFAAKFARRSVQLSHSARTSIAQAAAELRMDTTLRIVVTAWPDTNTQKAGNLKLAQQRLQAVRAELVKKLKIPDRRVSVSTMPQGPPPALDSLVKVMAENNNLVNVDIVGRRARMPGPPLSYLLPRDADERAKRADTLQIGDFTTPFPYKGLHCLVQLSGREAPRQKTFEEAAPEVSSSFQDYEAKRLESVWIDGLKKEFPVTEHKELLQQAFAPAR
jgi:peptidyl-prolyl cis-trans isomerase SurA